MTWLKTFFIIFIVTSAVLALLFGIRQLWFYLDELKLKIAEKIIEKALKRNRKEMASLIKRKEELEGENNK